MYFSKEFGENRRTTVTAIPDAAVERAKKPMV